MRGKARAISDVSLVRMPVGMRSYSLPLLRCQLVPPYPLPSSYLGRLRYSSEPVCHCNSPGPKVTGTGCRCYMQEGNANCIGGRAHTMLVLSANIEAQTSLPSFGARNMRCTA